MRLLAPDIVVPSVADLAVTWLDARGIKLILLDRDNTIATPKEHIIPASVRAWIARAREHGFLLAIVSNNTHTQVIADTAKELGISYISGAWKPLPFGVKRACEVAGIHPRETALVGDQIFTDCLAAKLAGTVSVKVSPLSPNEAPWSTALRRIGEACAGIRRETHRGRS